MKKLKFTKKKVIYFDEAFEIYLDRFSRLTKKDKKIQREIPEKQKKLLEKSGMFSHATRYLIKNYVDANWEVYCQKMGVKE